MGKAPKKNSTNSSGLDSSITLYIFAHYHKDEIVILKYLQAQNRPYSATDVFNNLHGQVGKTAVTKVLTTLVDKGEISGKAYGKQWVYVARQDTLPTPSPEELERLEGELEETKSFLTEQRERTKQTQELAGLQSSLTNEEIEIRIGQLERDIILAETKLGSLRAGTRKVDPKEKMEVDKKYELYAKEWKSRKRICMEIVNSIAENLPQSPSAFMEELGMESDSTDLPKK